MISNVDARPHSDPAVIKDILTKQVTSPVQWETTMNNLIASGLEQSYELGPGKVGREQGGVVSMCLGGSL